MLLKNFGRMLFIFLVIFVCATCSFSSDRVENKTPPPTVVTVPPETSYPNYVDLYKKNWQSVVWIKLTMETEGRIEPNSGSGVVVSSEKISSIEYAEYIITAHHVIRNWKEIYIHTPHRANKRFEKFLATVVGFDKKSDLALLKIITPQKILPAPLGDSDNLEIGEWVYAIGCPLDRTWSLAVGVVGNLSGSVTEGIQFDGSLRPGNSGGGLFNTKGELVGITLSNSSEKLGYAVSVNNAKEFLAGFIKLNRP